MQYMPISNLADLEEINKSILEPKYLDPDQVDGKCQQAKDCSIRKGYGIDQHDPDCAMFYDNSGTGGDSFGNY